MGTLYIVSTPIGNLSDISPRALDVLKSVGFIAAEDTRRTLPLLSHFQIRTPVFSYPKFNEESRSAEFIERLRAPGASAALVSDAGTPCINDPGAVLVDLAHANGISVVPVPGASSVTAALSVSGFAAGMFSYLGFFPSKRKKIDEFAGIIKSSEISVFVLLIPPQDIMKTLGELQKSFPDCDLCVCNDLTKLHERIYRGCIADVLSELEQNESRHLGEYTVVLRKNSVKPDEAAPPLSAEAMIVDVMVQRGVSPKEAVNILKSENPPLSKKDLYQKALNLKKLLKGIKEE